MQADSPLACGPRIQDHDTVVLASDMHLGSDAPATAERFFAALDHETADVTQLFLLGDLFEVWVGDDALDPLAEALAKGLRRLVARGTQVWLMRGNRDFMLDVPLPAHLSALPYSQRCGATLLEDPCVLDWNGVRTVLSHGDALCTDDQAYQAWRAVCRSPAWQNQMAARPLDERAALGQAARAQSSAGPHATPLELMDVNAAAVDALLERAQATHLIHGHTHRPGQHCWTPAGHTTPRYRTVLTDWAPDRGALWRGRAGAQGPVWAPSA